MQRQISQVQSSSKVHLDHSTSPNLPLHFLDTNLLASLLVIVKPLPLSQVDGGEFTTRVDTSGMPLALAKNYLVRPITLTK